MFNSQYKHITIVYEGFLIPVTLNNTFLSNKSSSKNASQSECNTDSRLYHERPMMRVFAIVMNNDFDFRHKQHGLCNRLPGISSAVRLHLQFHFSNVLPTNQQTRKPPGEDRHKTRLRGQLKFCQL